MSKFLQEPKIKVSDGTKISRQYVNGILNNVQGRLVNYTNIQTAVIELKYTETFVSVFFLGSFFAEQKTVDSSSHSNTLSYGSCLSIFLLGLLLPKFHRVILLATIEVRSNRSP